MMHDGEIPAAVSEGGQGTPVSLAQTLTSSPVTRELAGNTARWRRRRRRRISSLSR